MGEAEERKEHRKRHVELHRELDELIADFISDKSNKGALLSNTTIMELMHWSYEQTLKPTEKGEENGRKNEGTSGPDTEEKDNQESIIHE